MAKESFQNFFGKYLNYKEFRKKFLIFLIYYLPKILS